MSEPTKAAAGTVSGSSHFDGVAVVPGRYRAQGASRPRYLATLGTLALALALGILIATVWDSLVTDESTYACPPDCGRPPNGMPVANLPRFVAPDGEFSVAYPASGPDYAVITQANGVTAKKISGDGGELRLFGESAQSRVARRVVEDLMAREFPGAEVAYKLPNATVGYQLGYGVVATFQRPGFLTLSRVIVMAAVKNDLALVAVAEGPFRRFAPDFGPGPPSAANVEIAMDMGKYAESFSWRDDPPR